MTVQEAVEIRDRAIRLGLRGCCDQCAADIEALAPLGERNQVTIIPPSLPAAVAASKATDPVIGSAMEDAARRLRRSIGRGKEAS